MSADRLSDGPQTLAWTQTYGSIARTLFLYTNRPRPASGAATAMMLPNGKAFRTMKSLTTNENMKFCPLKWAPNWYIPFVSGADPAV